ncbi:uncharacterized protein LOC110696199 [Chenopodium quinoa]|uniref:uncharacterized protein LOC110696199 n=1 Tax=Chenopodium quinoa TaxID=63459 RepID=UPI000B786F0C|nr:uncharacterized protein LOC110696199 [Chenopodium quinoa]
MARIRGTTMDPNYRGGDSNELSPERQGPDEAAREPSGGTPATPSDNILGSYNEETSPAQEAEQPRTANEGPNSPSGSDDGRVESSSSSYLTMSEDSEEAERPSWQSRNDPLMIAVSLKDRALMRSSLTDFITKRPLGGGYKLLVPGEFGTVVWEDDQPNANKAKNMLPTAKTPAKKASDIRKENLEKKLAAQAAKKDGGVIPRSLQKQIRQRPSVEEPALNVQRTASTAPATTGGKSIKTPGGSNTETASKEVTPIRTATGPSAAGGQKASQKGTNPFNLTLLDLPMQALLRVEGLKKAYIRKQEEADQVKSLQNALKESKTKIDNLQAALDNAEDKLKKHEEPHKRLDQAEKSSKRLQL